MEEVKEWIEQYKIIVICRGVYGEALKKTMEALYEGGIRLAEVTFDQKNGNYEETMASIAMLNEHFKGKMLIGAGTVVSEEQVALAHQAKAAYIISPNVNEAVIRKTKALGMVSIPGALTPTEILTAHACGADFVKLFPAAWMTPRYIKDVKGPISHVKMIATAGVTEENIQDFAAVGCVGYGISGRLIDKKLIAEGRFTELKQRAEAFMQKLKESNV